MTTSKVPSISADHSPGMNSSAATELITRLMTEGFIGTGAVARLVGSLKGGRPVHPSTIARWVLTGVRTLDGRMVRLEAARVAGKFATSKPAVLRFIAAQQTESVVPAIPRSPAERNRVAEAAGKLLEASGA